MVNESAASHLSIYSISHFRRQYSTKPCDSISKWSSQPACVTPAACPPTIKKKCPRGNSCVYHASIQHHDLSIIRVINTHTHAHSVGPYGTTDVRSREKNKTHRVRLSTPGDEVSPELRSPCSHTALETPPLSMRRMIPFQNDRVGRLLIVTRSGCEVQVSCSKRGRRQPSAPANRARLPKAGIRNRGNINTESQWAR